MVICGILVKIEVQWAQHCVTVGWVLARTDPPSEVVARTRTRDLLFDNVRLDKTATTTVLV